MIKIIINDNKSKVTNPWKGMGGKRGIKGKRVTANYSQGEVREKKGGKEEGPPPTPPTSGALRSRIISPLSLTFSCLPRRLFPGLRDLWENSHFGCSYFLVRKVRKHDCQCSSYKLL